MGLVVVVGNPAPGSRTLSVATGLARRLTDRLGVEHASTIDLALHADRMFMAADDEVDELNAAVAASELLVVASPTFKAAYTGLLKAFFDRYGTAPLVGVTAIPVMTANAPTHALAVEHTLRPLLVELGASVPTAGLCFLMSDFDRLDSVLDGWVEAHITGTALCGPAPRRDPS